MIDAKGNYVPDPTPVASPIVQPTIPTPTPQQIYSAENIQSAATSPIAAPDLSNASSIYDFYMGGSGVSAARRQAEIDQKALAEAKKTARNRQIAIEGNQLEGMSYITGAQSRAGQLENAALQALADTAGISSASYEAARADARERANIALGQRSELLSMIQQNPGAKISFTDTIESAMGKVRTYTKKQEKKAEEKSKDDYKKNLKATLMQLGISTKNSNGGSLNTKEMERALTENYKSEKAAKKKLESLKLKSAELDLAKGYKDLNAKDEKPVNFTDTEQRRLASELLDEAESKGLYGNYAWEYAVKEGNKLGVAIESGSPFVNSIRTRFGLGSESAKKAGDK